MHPPVKLSSVKTAHDCFSIDIYILVIKIVTWEGMYSKKQKHKQKANLLQPEE